jgi:phage gp36-like protein
MPVPVANPPGMLRLLCCRITWYLLLGSAVDEATREDYKAARDYLRQVAEGRVALTMPDQAAPVTGVGPVLFDAGQKVMGREGAATDTGRSGW